MRRIKTQNIAGVRYEWRKLLPGEKLDLHFHATEDLCHATLIVSGEFDVLGSRAGTIARSGDFFPWAVGEEHGLIARTAGLFVNIRLACLCDPPERDWDDPWPEVMPPGLDGEQQAAWRLAHPGGRG